MSLTATDKGGADFEMTPEGTYIGRCFKIIDMGTQTSVGQFGTKEQHKVMISFELFDKDEQGKDVVMNDGRPYSVTQFYTVSLHEKAKLRADLEAWRGKKFTKDELEGFDLSNVLGAYCMIQVVHDETGKYANVNSIMSYKGDKPKPVNPDVVFDIDNPDMKVFEAMSDNMKAKIQAAPEWKGSPTVTPNAAPEAQATPQAKPDNIVGFDENEPINLDDIPF
jgi:hypothetical protein